MAQTAVTSVRRRKLVAGAGALLLLGLAYVLACRYLQLSIPCPFFVLTGLECPGCGVTRMLLALIRLDFSAAWRFNPVVLLLLAPLGILAVRLSHTYVVTGVVRPSGGENAVIWGMVFLLLAFGVLRNLPLCGPL